MSWKLKDTYIHDANMEMNYDHKTYIESYLFIKIKNISLFAIITILIIVTATARPVCGHFQYFAS